MNDKEVRKELEHIMGKISIKDQLLAWHRKTHDDYEGFDNYNDYIKYGGMFVPVEPPKKQEETK